MEEQKKRILVVEDDETHAELVKYAFRRFADQFYLTVVDNLAEAHEYRTTWRPDLIIADWLLPDGKGTALLSKQGDAPPVIVMTSHGNEQIAVEAMKAGALDYIVKSNGNLSHLPRAAERALREWHHIVERKRAEEALRASEARYRRIVETAQEGIWIIDADNVTTFVNQKMAEMLGYTTREMIGQSLYNFMDEQARQIAQANVERRRQGIEEQHEFIFRCKDGNKIYALLNTSSNFDEKGEYTGALAMVSDITERKQAEQTRARLAAVVESSHDAIISKTLDGIVLSWNTGAERIYGYSANEVIGRHISMLVPDGYEEEIVKFLEEVRKGKPINHYETVRIRKNGQRIHVALTLSPIKDTGNNITGVSTIARDISERKQAEAERARLVTKIQHQAQQVQQIIDTVPEGVLMLDTTNNVILANPVAKKDLGVLAQAEVGDTLTYLGNRPLEELLASPPKGLWHEIESNTDPPRSFEAIAQPVKTEPANGGWVIVIRDVTREREIQKQATQQNRLVAVGQLAAGIAHDFNNIIAVIVLYTEIIMRTADLPLKTQERLRTISQQAHRATELIEQILDFSRQAVMKRRNLDLLPFLKEQVKLLGRTVPENIKINLMYAPGTYMTNADPTRIQQAILNLVVNARDAMPEGGDLRIALKRVKVEEGENPPLPEMEAQEWIQITVSDTGTGISSNIQPYIFEPFFTTKAPGKGTGLGLSQVYGIVKQHNGHIDVHTEPGAGTTFVLYLPALPQPEANIVTPDSETLPKGAGEIILVVEDDLATRAALVESLNLLNYRVLTADNGKEALVKVNQYQDEIALILSDVVMPDMGGVALFHALQKQAPTIQVVLVTGHLLENETDNNFESLRAQGLADWLQKPPSLHRLAHTLANALKQ